MPASPEKYFQRRVTIPRKIAHPGWWWALTAVLAVGACLHLAFVGDLLVFFGTLFGSVLASHCGYLSHVLLDVAARTELNNAVLADMLHKAKDPRLDAYWALNAVYIEKDM